MYRIEIWEGALLHNGERYISLCDHDNKRIIVGRTPKDTEQERLEAVAEAVRLEMARRLRVVPVIGEVG